VVSGDRKGPRDADWDRGVSDDVLNFDSSGLLDLQLGSSGKGFYDLLTFCLTSSLLFSCFSLFGRRRSV